MKFMLLAGLAFWTVIAFVGVRKGFEQGGNALTEKLRAVHELHPGSLLGIGVIGFAAGAGLVIAEIVRIGQLAGTLGGFWMLGILCAVMGAACMSAHTTMAREG